MGENRDVGWGCLFSSPSQVGAVPLRFPHLDALGFWDLLTWLGLGPKSCVLLAWTLPDCGICWPGWVCAPGSAHLDTPSPWDPLTCWVCAFRTCSPGCSQTPGSAGGGAQGPKSPNPAAATPLFS